MRKITLGTTGITTVQNAFGVLPLQRTPVPEAVKILQKAYEGGITFYDTARAYSDSEEKIGLALSDVRKNIFIATKTMAQNTDDMKKQLEESLKKLKTDYIDIYQFHCASHCINPEDKSGMYELMENFKRQGLMSEALRAVIARLFDEEGMDYVQCGYFDFNAVSRAFQEKLGFTHLATMEIDFKGERVVTVENALWKK